MSAEEYTLVFTPRYGLARYGAESNTFTITGDLQALAYELVKLLEKLQLSKGHWRLQQHEESGTITIIKDESAIYLINHPNIIHDVAFAWCSLDGKHTVQMFDASPATDTKYTNNLRKANP